MSFDYTDPSPRALVLGTFDLIHSEHLFFLNEAARLGRVIVGLGTDKYQEGYKRQPVLTFEERKAALRELPMVAHVAPREDVSIIPLIKEFEPEYLVAGVDWVEHSPSFLELSGIDVGFLAHNQINLVFICSERLISTSKILDRIQNGT